MLLLLLHQLGRDPTEQVEEEAGQLEQPRPEKVSTDEETGRVDEEAGDEAKASRKGDVHQATGGEEEVEGEHQARK